MIYLDQTCSSPAANIALDEWLLDETELDGKAWLRTWQPEELCVVLGRGNRAHTEVKLDACARAGVPVLKRSSGGGAVLLGPGCFCYTVILPLDAHVALASAQGANDWILRRMARAIGGVTPAGDSDLTLADRKVAGHAQRRKRSSVMLHGVLLLEFDVDQMERFLRFPSRSPAYREGRGHREFVVNLRRSSGQIADALIREWGTEPAAASVPECRLRVDELSLR